MKYLWIILALGLVLSPLLALQPSSRQRQQQRLRARAMARGLQVQFSERQDTWSAAGKCICYRLPVPRDRRLEQLLVVPWILQRDAEAGTWQQTAPARAMAGALERIHPALERLPADVCRLILGGRGLAVEWYERGDEQAVDEIADTLEKLHETLQLLRPVAGAGED